MRKTVMTKNEEKARIVLRIKNKISLSNINLLSMLINKMRNLNFVQSIADVRSCFTTNGIKQHVQQLLKAENTFTGLIKLPTTTTK